MRRVVEWSEAEKGQDFRILDTFLSDTLSPYVLGRIFADFCVGK